MSERQESARSNRSSNTRQSGYGGMKRESVVGQRIEDMGNLNTSNMLTGSGEGPEGPDGSPHGLQAENFDESLEADQLMEVDIEQRVESLFPLYAHGDAELSFLQFHSLLEEVGLTVSEDDLRAQVGDERIDLDLAVDVASQLHAAEFGGGIATVGSAEGGTQLITPFQFLKMKLTCRTRKGVKYQIIWPKVEIELGPRKILLIGTLAMLLVTSLAVIGIISAIWVNTETGREERILTTLGSTVASFAELFESNWVNIAGKEAESETDVFAAYLGRAHQNFLDQDLGKTMKRARVTSSAHERSYEALALTPQLKKVKGRMMTLRSAYRSALRVESSASSSSTPVPSSHALAFSQVARETYLTSLLHNWTNYNNTNSFGGGVGDDDPWDYALFKVDLTPAVASTTGGTVLTTSRYDSVTGETRTSPQIQTVQCLEFIYNSAATFTSLNSSSSGGTTLVQQQSASTISDLSPSADLQGKTSKVMAISFPVWGLGVCAFYRSDNFQASAIATRAARIQESRSLLEHQFASETQLAVLVDSSNSTNSATSSQGSLTSSWLVGAQPRGLGSSTCYSKSTVAQQVANGADVARCNEIDNMVTNSLLSQTANSSKLISWNNTLSLCAVVSSRTGIAFTLCLPESYVLNITRRESVLIIDHLNFNFVRSTEIVASYQDESTGAIQAQISAFRFFDGCFAACERTLPSSLNAIAAFERKDSGFSITPDYRPEPVMGGYKYSSELRMAYLIERDVIEIRGRASDVLILILDDYNKVATGAEIVATRPTQYPPMKTFVPWDPCPTGVTCFDVQGHGIVYRGDCIHCQRLLDPEIRTLNFLTTLAALPTSCNRSADCSDQSLSRYDLYHRPFAVIGTTDDSSKLTTASAVGYMGDDNGKVIAGYSFLSNLSLGIVTQWPQRNYQTPIIERIGLSVGVALVFVALALITLMVQSRKYLDDIELDWKKYKEQISEENERFSETVLEVLPSRVAEKMMRGELLFAETKPLTVMMVNYVGFQDKIHTLGSPALVAVYSSYTFLLISTVCRHFRVHKVRTVGDLVVAAGGISHEENDVDGPSRTAVRVTQAACCVIQLFSYIFDHNMPSVPALANMNTAGLERILGGAAGSLNYGGGGGGGTAPGASGGAKGRLSDADKGLPSGNSPPGMKSVGSPAVGPAASPGASKLDNPTTRKGPTNGPTGKHALSAGGGSSAEAQRALEMPDVKVGINQGSCTLCVLGCFNTPNFDVLGPTVSITQRLQSSAKRNTINVSQTVMECLDKMKVKESLTFSKERRQTWKNQSVRSNLILGANVPIPPTIMHQLGIRRSHPRMFFTEDGTATTAMGSSTASYLNNKVISDKVSSAPSSAPSSSDDLRKARGPGNSTVDRV